jgi:hypothetical protein
MKKLGLFFFSIGVSAAFTFAHAAGGDPACYAACDTNFDYCNWHTTTSAGACSKIYAMCYEGCDRAQGD